MPSPDNAPQRYALSFTSGALLAREAVIAAPLFLELRDWDAVRARLNEDNLLQTRTESSRERVSREVVQRLAVLTEEELELLIDAGPAERGYLMWAAACRRYAFIGDFAEEVVRERFLLLTPELRYDDFDAFLHHKALWHPELSGIKESTHRKLRQTLFRMLSEAGLLADGGIVPAVLSRRLCEVLSKQSPSNARFFPYRILQEDTE